jgi:hypothetical protein
MFDLADKNRSDSDELAFNIEIAYNIDQEVQQSGNGTSAI